MVLSELFQNSESTLLLFLNHFRLKILQFHIAALTAIFQSHREFLGLPGHAYKSLRHLKRCSAQFSFATIVIKTTICRVLWCVPSTSASCLSYC